MKKLSLILITAIFLNTPNLSYSQLLNSGFESNTLNDDHCPDNSGDKSIDPFGSNNVSNWKCSHGSPQIYIKTKKDNISCNDNVFDAFNGKFCAFLSYSSNNCEGIFQDIQIDKDELINITITAKGNNSNSKLIIKLKNGLSNLIENVSFPASSLNNLIDVNNEQILLNQTLTTGWQTYYITNITAEQAFSQLWIYADVNDLKIDEVSLGISCCILKELYQNITNPPSTYRNDFIRAGNSVDLNKQFGNVIIDNSILTIFQAKNEIALEPGFETINNSEFIAQIDNCTNLSITIEIEKIKNACEHEYIARVCYGSGFYTFSWNLNGLEKIGDDNKHRIKFKPKSGRTII